MNELLLDVFSRAYVELLHKPAPPFIVDFYPYADIKHTIRRRQGRLLVRLSDALIDAPAEVLHSLAHILLGKILHCPIYKQHYCTYHRYIQLPQLNAEIAHLRVIRARHTMDSGPGRYFDLQEILELLNQQYFGNRLQGICILWTKNPSRRRLGYYRECVHTIVISRLLDQPKVPRYVVEYVVYHEMLHADLPTKKEGRRRRVHTAEFYGREMLFEKSLEAEFYLRHTLQRKTGWLRAFRLD